ncbi:heavy metal-responsive transcriptional regulator ['Osedax' symbiont bacterium Rs2_46_30_T18]|nr:heavy metal-responsive transcriptional regulator ['Osedax' symbiont bacterium Rs2_46_30_T18]
MDLFKIGVIAKMTGISVQALRYYQQRGLISPRQQLESGYRLYSKDVIERVQFIQRCQSIGFALEEILELLNLQQDPSAKAAQVKQRVDSKVHLVEQKLIELEQLKISLKQLSASCSGEGNIDDCPIISNLWS